MLDIGLVHHVLIDGAPKRRIKGLLFDGCIDGKFQAYLLAEPGLRGGPLDASYFSNNSSTVR
jgi:hypothetical protein